jgi:hypothetical protein
MRFLKYILPLFIFLVSCSEEQPERIPSDILAPEKMSDIFVSLNISEALINHNNGLSPENKKELKFNVFKENGVSREDYLKSMEFYSTHPKTLKSIYEKTVEKLNLMKEQ